MTAKIQFHWLEVVILVFACLGLAAHGLEAQEMAYSTIEQASTDPIVVRLLGAETLDRLVQAQQERAANNQASAVLTTGHHLASQLSDIVYPAVNNFASNRWDQEFDAKAYLLAVRKLQILRDTTTVPTVKQSVDGVLRRLEYKLNLNTVMYSLNWNFKQLQSSPSGSTSLSQVIEKDFMVVPFAIQELLERGHVENYQASHQSLLKQAGVASGGDLGDGSGFSAMSAKAERDAETWYAQHKETFEATQNAAAAEFRLAFFKSNIQSMLYLAAKKAITRNLSKAKSEFNDANNGLKYAEINSQKAAQSAAKDDVANAESYLSSARENAIELASATRRLSQCYLEAAELKKYMLGESVSRTRIANIGEQSLDELKTRLATAPRGGNENTVARNCLAEIISTTERLEQIESWLTKAEENCKKIAAAMADGEQAMTKLSNRSSKTMSSPFDVSSREAFEASKEHLSTMIPTDRFVQFTQAWVKLLQAAIKEDPMVMADDKKYLAFIKKHFEGKTVEDIIGK